MVKGRKNTKRLINGGCGCNQSGGSVGLNDIPQDRMYSYFNVENDPTAPNNPVSEHNTPWGAMSPTQSYSIIGGGGKQRRKKNIRFSMKKNKKTSRKRRYNKRW